MANRGCCLVLLLGLFVGGDPCALGQNVPVQILVYDYSGLQPSTLNDFRARTEAILTRAGVAVEVHVCPKGGDSGCQSRSGSLVQIAIRIISRAPNQPCARWQHLGQSIAGPAGGIYGTLFMETVREKASEENLPAIIVLAYAAAHEAGHLLLGSQAHTPLGLMKERWEAEDFQSMAQNRLRFTAGQIRELKERYGIPRRDGLGLEASLDTGQ